jgi:hypothetical protein
MTQRIRGEEVIGGLICMVMLAGFLYIIARPFLGGGS